MFDRLNRLVRTTPISALNLVMSHDFLGWLDHLKGTTESLRRRRDLIAEVCAEAAELERHAILLRARARDMEKDLLNSALSQWSLEELQHASESMRRQSTREAELNRIDHEPLRSAARAIDPAALSSEALLAFSQGQILAEGQPEIVVQRVRQWWALCGQPVLERNFETA